MLKIRTKRIGSKVLFPETGGEQVDLKGQMGVSPLEHIDEVDVGINVLQATGGEQTLDNTNVARAHFGPAEEPIPPEGRFPPMTPSKPDRAGLIDCNARAAPRA